MTAFSSVSVFGNPEYGGNPAFVSRQCIQNESRVPVQLYRDRGYLPLNQSTDGSQYVPLRSLVELIPADPDQDIKGILSVQLEFTKILIGVFAEGQYVKTQSFDSVSLLSGITQEFLSLGRVVNDEYSSYRSIEPCETVYSQFIQALTQHAVVTIGKNSCTIEP